MIGKFTNTQNICTSTNNFVSEIAIEYKSKYKMRLVQQHTFCLIKELKKLYLRLQKNLQRCKKR